jgi:hypothetical protein
LSKASSDGAACNADATAPRRFAVEMVPLGENLHWCRFLSQTAVHRIAPHGNGLQHRKVNRPVEDSIPGTADPS